VTIAAAVTLVTFFLSVLICGYASAADAGESRRAIQSAGSSTVQQPPNIILFVVDDMGWQDTSVEFHTQRTVWNDLYHTPSMEKLAARGMRFRSAYAPHPVCSPSRVSFMTGMNPARSGVDDWVGHGRSKNRYLKSPEWRSKGLQPGDGITTLPTILQKHGYRTIHIGKAHFGSGKGADPRNLGFDINIGGSHGGGPWGGWYSPWLTRYKAMYPNLEDRPEGEYLTDAITAEAEELIARAVKDEVPFFMNLAQFAVHTAYEFGPEEYAKHYRDGRPDVEAKYGSMLTGMDASLGRIMDRLDDPDADGDTADSIADNTIILFVSDNGGLSNHTRTRRGTVTLDGGVTVTYRHDFHNSPAKSGKGSGYDGGMRIPMIVAWAGQGAQDAFANESLKIKPGSVCDEPVHGDDIFPTILSIAGIKNPVPEAKRDGQDLRGLLTGKGFKRNGALYWHYPHQWYRNVGVGLGIEPFSAVRKGQWKLIYFYGDGVSDGKGYDPRVELYDLSKDIGEARNLAESKPEKAAELQEMLSRWLKEVGAGIPIVSATGRAADLPGRHIQRPAPEQSSGHTR
jgi:arylsulfatase A-like enzyme